MARYSSQIGQTWHLHTHNNSASSAAVDGNNNKSKTKTTPAPMATKTGSKASAVLLRDKGNIKEESSSQWLARPVRPSPLGSAGHVAMRSQWGRRRARHNKAAPKSGRLSGAKLLTASSWAPTGPVRAGCLFGQTIGTNGLTRATASERVFVCVYICWVYLCVAG